jgi:hypothetical protein
MIETNTPHIQKNIYTDEYTWQADTCRDIHMDTDTHEHIQMEHIRALYMYMDVTFIHMAY